MIGLARIVYGASVGKVTALRKIHSHNCVAVFRKCEICGKVCLCAGMRLNIGVLRAEKFAGTVARNVFHFVNIAAASVIPVTRIPLCIFIRKNAAHSGEHRRRNKVF